MKKYPDTTQELATSITKAASLQTASTIRFLADHELMPDAYRAYAYFRWVDDWIDTGNKAKRRQDRFCGSSKRTYP